MWSKVIIHIDYWAKVNCLANGQGPGRSKIEYKEVRSLEIRGVDGVEDFQIFVCHINAHQTVSSVEMALNNWKTGRLVHWVSASLCPQPFHAYTMGPHEE